MDQNKIQKELCIMINHYIRDKNPDIYAKLRDFYIQNHIFPEDEQNIDSILDLRYSDFPKNQFLLFLKTLTPKDDFPSLFRRMTAFEKPNEFIPSKCKLNILCSSQFHTDSIFSVEIDPLSRFFITGSDDKTLKIISLPFFKEIITLQGHTDVISNININYDISLLLSSSHDSTVRIWSLNNGCCLSVLTNITTSDVHYASFSPDGNFIAAACEDGSLFIWKTQDALEQKPPFYQFKSPELTPVVWLSFSPGSEFVCHVAEQNRVTVYSLSTGKSFELKPLSGNITYVSFSRRLYPSNIGMAPKIVTFSSEEGTMSIFSVKNSSYQLQHVFRPSSSGKKGIICSMCWDYDDHLAVVVRQTSVVVYDTISGKTVSQLPEIEVVTNCYLLAANPKFTNLYAFVSANAMFTVWDIHEIELLASYTDKEEVIFHEIKWTPCGRFIVTADHIGRVLFFCFTMDGHKCSLINVSTNTSFIYDDYFRLKKSSENFLNYQVKTDTTFSNKCQKEETELANKIDVNTDNEAAAQNRNHSIVVQQPPDPIYFVYRKPLNPSVLKKDDDPEFFKNINDDDGNEQQLKVTNADSDKNTDNNDDEDLANIAFESEGELTPVLAPNDPSQFILYEPFITLDKPYWVIATSTFVFVPQKGDQVLYINSANHFDIISDNMSDFSFPPLLRCQIKDVHLSSSVDDNYLIVDLDAPFLDSSYNFQITYRFDDFCEYLFPITAMASYVRPIGNLEPGHHIEFWFDGVRCTGEIISIRPDYQANPYESITVSGLDATVDVSPWQILQYNGIPASNPYDKNNENINYEVAVKAIESIVKKDEYEMFYDMSNDMQKCASEIDFPVDVKFIIERLIHGWYRTSIAFQNDIEKMHQNVKIIFNDQQDIIQLSSSLKSQCLDLIQRNVVRIR